MSEFYVVDDSPAEAPEALLYQPTAPPRGGAGGEAGANSAAPFRAAVAAASRRSAPSYGEILSGAWWLRLMASLQMIFGVIGLALSVWVALRLASEPHTITLAGFVLVGGVIGFVINFASAALLRMQAAMGEALRDLARNSFR